VAARVRFPSGALGALMAVTSLTFAACSVGLDGTYPPASRFDAREVPCEETEEFGTATGEYGAVDSPEDMVCWVRGNPSDIGGLLTGIRNQIAPNGDVAALVEPECEAWPGSPSIRACSIGGVIEDNPYTVVSVTAWPSYSEEEMGLIAQGERVDSRLIEIRIQTVALGDSIDLWRSDMQGTHDD